MCTGHELLQLEHIHILRALKTGLTGPQVNRTGSNLDYLFTTFPSATPLKNLGQSLQHPPPPGVAQPLPQSPSPWQPRGGCGGPCAWQ